jgi:hypothetical protein
MLLKQFATVAAIAAVTTLTATAAHAQWTVTNLNPAGSMQSEAFAASGGQQAGRAAVGGIRHAGLWSGSAASWVDLHPAGATLSEAYAVSGGQQAGIAAVGGAVRASLWSGTAASWVDLHAFLPAGFTSSRALGISTDGAYTYIAGYGFNTVTNRDEALLWTQPIPTPASAALLALGGLVAARRRRA